MPVSNPNEVNESINQGNDISTTALKANMNNVSNHRIGKKMTHKRLTINDLKNN